MGKNKDTPKLNRLGYVFTLFKITGFSTHLKIILRYPGKTTVIFFWLTLMHLILFFFLHIDQVFGDTEHKTMFFFMSA